MHTLSSELATSPQLTHATPGKRVNSLILLIKPLCFSVQIWLECFFTQLQLISTPMMVTRVSDSLIALYYTTM